MTRLTYEPVGSGEGVRRFLGEGINPSEAVDFAVSDSPLTDSQLAQRHGPTAMIPVTAGCIVLAYRLPDLPGSLNLPRDVYVDIFLGRIERWNDARIARANPGVRLPELAIGRVVRQDASGTTAAFTSHLAAISQSWRDQVGSGTRVNWPGSGVITGRGNEGVAGLIRNFEGMIGYVGYEFAHKLDLNIAALENHDGRVVQPSLDTCGAALAAAVVPDDLRIRTPDPTGDDAYPIVTFSWLLLRRDGDDRERSAALRDFVRWSLQTGQNEVMDLGYVKLPETVIPKALQILDGAAQTASH